MKTIRQVRRQARELFRFCLVDGLPDESRVHQVVRTVIGSKRRGCIALLSEFQRLVRLKQRQYTAEVASAVPLSADLRLQVSADLQRLYGTGLEVRFIQEPDLIGGMRVAVGSDVYDGSVRYRLALLNETFSTPGTNRTRQSATLDRDTSEAG